MNSNTVTLLVALLSFAGMIIAGLITAYTSLKSKNRELAATGKQNGETIRIQEWEQWRKDNESLRAEIADLRLQSAEFKTEIRRLEKRIDEMGDREKRLEEEVIGKQRECDRVNQDKDKAIRDRERIQREKEATVKEAALWKERFEKGEIAWSDRFEKEHIAASTFAQLYDFYITGRTPDPLMLEKINSALIAAGYLPTPPPPPPLQQLSPPTP